MRGGMGDAHAPWPVVCGLAGGNGSRTRFRTIPRRRHSGGTRSLGWARTRPPRGGRARPGLLWANRGVDRRGGARPSIGVTWLLDRPPAAKGNGSRTRFRAPRRNQHSGGTRPHGWVRTRPPEGGRARPDPLWADRGVGRMTRASRLRLPGKSGPAKATGHKPGSVRPSYASTSEGRARLVGANAPAWGGRVRPGPLWADRRVDRRTAVKLSHSIVGQPATAAPLNETGREPASVPSIAKPPARPGPPHD